MPNNSQNNNVQNDQVLNTSPVQNNQVLQTSQTTTPVQDSQISSQTSIVQNISPSQIQNTEAQVGNQISQSNVENSVNNPTQNAQTIATPLPQKNPALEDKVIFNIAEEKEGNPLVVIAFFVILIGFVFLLEPISKYMDKIFNQEPAITTPTNQGLSTEPSQSSSPEEKKNYYKLNTNIISFEKLKLYNLTFLKDEKLNNFVSFSLTNDSDEIYNFDKNYFIEYYEEEDGPILSRTLIHSYSSLEKGTSLELTFPISKETVDSAKLLRIVEIKTSEYPSVKMTETDGDYQVLTCKYLNTEMKYYFLNDKLDRTIENYKVSTDTDANKLIELYNQQSALIDKYKQNGIDATIAKHPDNEFYSKVTIDYKLVQPALISELKQYRFFRDGENSSIIAFEMRAMGYTCS